MKKQYKLFYLVSLIIIILLSAYPLYMGIVVLAGHFSGGGIAAGDYPKYIIPYAPICIGILVTAILLPGIYKLNKRASLWIASCMGAILYLASELLFEQIKVVEIQAEDFGIVPIVPIDAWQYSLCMATPEVLESIGEPVYAGNNPAFKIHFYLIAIVIVLSVIGILHGFTRSFQENKWEKKRPLIVQTICVVIFIGLCILACLTAFYRNGTLYISPLSAFLTGLFFVVLGTTFGVYFSCHLYGKGRLLGIILPTASAVLATIAMYIGELVMMDGRLFRFGRGVFFEPVGKLILSPCDFGIVILAGIVTGIISYLLNLPEKKEL